MAILLEDCFRAQEFIHGKMAASTRENLLGVREKEKAYGDPSTETNFRAAIQTISKMAGENLPGKTDKSTRESSKTISVTASVVTVTQTVKSVPISG